MPGRGNYWQKGGLPDETVTQDDIDPDYRTTIEGGGGGGGHVIRDESVDLPDQPKLNFVGDGVLATNGEGETNVTIKAGAFELIKTVTLGSNADPAVITPDTPITFADYSEIELIVVGKIVTADGQIEITINNTGANSLYEWIGSIAGGGVSAFVEHPSDPSWRLNNLNMAQDSLFYLKIVLGGGANLQPNLRKGTGVLTWEDFNNATRSSVGGLQVSDPSLATTVASFEVGIGGTGQIGAGSVLSLFGKKVALS